VRAVTIKYAKVLKDPQNNFSIFSIIAKPDAEVEVHSRFISELLDSSGSHHQGDVFLRLFLEQLGMDSFDPSIATVRREYQKIDIFITTSQKQAIVIENKINAEDQDRQLERYVKSAEQEGYTDIVPVYLTLDGREPSKRSLGSLDPQRVRRASYGGLILPWMSDCIRVASLQPVLRETFVQYSLLVRKLTGQHPSEEYVMELKDLLLSTGNFKLATDLSKALTKAKAEIHLRFWCELEKQLKEKGYEITNRNKYTEEKIIRSYQQVQNRWDYGLVFELREQPFKDEELYFGILTDGKVFYCFRALRGDSWKAASDGKFDALAGLLASKLRFTGRSEWSLGWLYWPPQIDFVCFDDPLAFDLIDDSKREGIVAGIVAEVDGILQRYGELVANLGTG